MLGRRCVSSSWCTRMALTHLGTPPVSGWTMWCCPVLAEHRHQVRRRQRQLHPQPLPRSRLHRLQQLQLRLRQRQLRHRHQHRELLLLHGPVRHRCLVRNVLWIAQHCSFSATPLLPNERKRSRPRSARYARFHLALAACRIAT